MSHIGGRPRVVTLGTAGGPRWWRGEAGRRRTGIATAIVVGDAYYLVDCGTGVGRQLERAQLPVRDLRAIFITHLHSDHVVDLASLVLFNLTDRMDQLDTPVKILGPGDRGVLPPVSRQATGKVEPVFPENPTPGTADMFRLLMAAHATDLNDRILDNLRPSPFELFDAVDISLPLADGYDPNAIEPPRMKPFIVFEDDRVKVTATLVQHPPIAPAFSFRFDTDGGSVVISGDTTYTENMIEIAESADLLLHEALDYEWMRQRHGTSLDPRAKSAMEHHAKSHSSIEQAVEIGRRASVRRLALHHLVPGQGRRWRSTDDRFLIPDDLDVVEL